MFVVNIAQGAANRRKIRFHCLWYSERNEPITKSDSQKFDRISTHLTNYNNKQNVVRGYFYAGLTKSLIRIWARWIIAQNSSKLNFRKKKGWKRWLNSWKRYIWVTQTEFIYEFSHFFYSFESSPNVTENSLEICAYNRILFLKPRLKSGHA